MEMKEYLTREDLQYFVKKDNRKAFLLLIANWVSIFAILAMVYIWTNPLTILLALILLPGRQLGLAVLMHDCGHNVLFESKRLNQFFGQWFCANAVLQDLPSYAKNHLRHHKAAGTKDDPDLGNYQDYPVELSSFRRKIKRDLTGKTGGRLLKYVLKSAMGYLNKETRDFSKPFLQELFVQLVFMTILALAMSPYLYLLWIISWLTTYMFVVRFRQVAEHASVADLFDLDPRKNTRTTVPNWLERILIAPNYVNYHLEHHFLASIPCYRLAELHHFLKNKGAYTDTNIAYGYRQVLREALV